MALVLRQPESAGSMDRLFEMAGPSSFVFKLQILCLNADDYQAQESSPPREVPVPASFLFRWRAEWNVIPSGSNPERLCTGALEELGCTRAVPPAARPLPRVSATLLSWSLAVVTLAVSRLLVAAVCSLLSSVVQQEEEEGQSGQRFLFLVTFLISDGNLPHGLCLSL